MAIIAAVGGHLHLCTLRLSGQHENPQVGASAKVSIGDVGIVFDNVYNL